ncbi:probable cytochrome P450 6a13 [Planococcus citri]|uniref:probable cytochrome P450 6a13 n=1 Tax=Planococcus citri TaxID=170843 RepID=UPI0031F95315
MFAYILSTLSLLIVTLFLCVCYYFKKSHEFFSQYGIPHLKPHWLFGNMKDVVLMKKALWLGMKEMYQKLPSEKFAGVYTLYTPSVMIRDPELIKVILIKDFSYFQDRGIPTYREVEPMSDNLFTLTGDDWKNLRIKLTSTYTSLKMKMMFPLVKKCAEDIRPALDKYFESGQDFEGKDLAARFMTDVIGSCAFGVDTHSLEDPDSEFRKMGRNIFVPRWQAILRLLVPAIPASFVKHFKLQFFALEICDYFMKIVKDMVKYRAENQVTRGDFLDLLIEMKNSKDSEKVKDEQTEADLSKFMSQIGKQMVKKDVDLTIELMAAQCFIFFVGGFEGGASTIMYMLFELAQHPEIQDKVRQEILSTLESNEGELTYEMMKSMTYLNMVIDETLRRYPVGGALLLRECRENYKIPDSNAIIKKGTRVIIPAIGLHYDEKYYEKPDEFYPEHFSEEAKSKRHHFAYMPFGEGPRICIGQRFAKMQLIVGAIYLLKDFAFELSPKTKVPLEYSFGGLMLVKDGIWLRCQPL